MRLNRYPSNFELMRARFTSILTVVEQECSALVIRSITYVKRHGPDCFNRNLQHRRVRPTETFQNVGNCALSRNPCQGQARDNEAALGTKQYGGQRSDKSPLLYLPIRQRLIQYITQTRDAFDKGRALHPILQCSHARTIYSSQPRR